MTARVSKKGSGGRSKKRPVWYTWPLRRWKFTLLAGLFLLGGLITNLDRSDAFARRAARFLPGRVAGMLVRKPAAPVAGIANPGEAVFGTVTRVIDGDTIEVKSVGVREDSYRVRMWGIDAPETSQEYGREAAAALRAKVENRPVSLLVAARDRYGRLVCKVYGDRDEDVNLYMVASGNAWYYEQYAPGETALAGAQGEAQRRRIGLWKSAAPVPPWQFRKD
ncbi:MAG: thermonuclease family protein [Victivallaceae bacterium]|nr:thermonuclease family protein [Victivallaceae bacterium]